LIVIGSSVYGLKLTQMRKLHLLCAVPLTSLFLAACGSSDSSSQSGGDGGGDDVVLPLDDGGAVDGSGGDDAATPQEASTTPVDGGLDGTVSQDASTDAMAVADASPDAARADAAPADASSLDAQPDGSGVVDASPEGSTPDAAPDGGVVDAASVDAAPDTGPTYAIGGSVTGLAAGDSVVLQNNAGETVTVSANTTFTFPTHLAPGAGYDVKVLTSPTAPISQSCSVTAGGAGNVVDADVSGVTIQCTTNVFALGVTVSGLAANESVTLADDVGDSVVVSANGTVPFASSYASGASFMVTATAQPANPILQTCVPAPATGSVGAADVNVAVTCTTNPYALGGTVHGLGKGKSLVLTESGSGQVLPISANGTFTFTSLIPNGNAYVAVVSTQPTNTTSDPAPQVCNVVSGSGTMPQGAEAGIEVYCGTNCAAIQTVISILGSGNFQIDPDGSDPGAPFQAYCDMNFDGGGWTLAESTNGGSCGPGVEVSDVVSQGTCAFMPIASVEALANLGTSVHVRSASGFSTPTKYATSATGLPIANLRLGALLDANEDATTAETHWTTVGVPASALDFSCVPGSGAPGWPSVYWAACNGSGWHLVSPPGQGNYSTWQWNTANVAMEVYVR
jgi:hypothetical protein